MAKQVPSAVMRLVPHLHRVVTKYNGLVTNPDVGHILGPAPMSKELRLSPETLVMVAKYKKLLSVEAPCDFDSSLGTTKCEVAKMINRISRLNDIVPPGDHFLIHLLEVLKRAFGVFDNVCVPVMSQVSDVKNTLDIMHLPLAENGQPAF